MNPNLITLEQRYDWLRILINTKRNVGKDTQQDEREADALAWAIDILRAIARVTKQHDA